MASSSLSTLFVKIIILRALNPNFCVYWKTLKNCLSNTYKSYCKVRKNMKHIFDPLKILFDTRPKPAYGRQGLGWDRQARIQFRQVQFGMDTLWEYITNKGPQLTSFGAKTLRH